jgi:thiamine biosynthesis lipoprotein ApbE
MDFQARRNLHSTSFGATGCMFNAWVSSTDHDAARHALNSAYSFISAAEKVLVEGVPDSEIARLNSQAGSPVKVSPLLREVIAAALDCARITNSACDPLTAPGVTGQSDLPAAPGSGLFPLRQPVATWQDVRLTPESSVVTLPLGCSLDLGMTGRAWLADKAADTLSKIGPCLVDAGGYLAARGRPERREGWVVGVMDPFRPEEDLVTLEIQDCGVATVAAPAGAGDLASVTVIARDLVTADAFARASLRLGRTAASDLVRDMESVQVLFVPVTGEPLATGQFSRYIAA